MSKEAFLYLDFMRVSAALLVFLSHVSGSRLTGGFLWQVDRYGGQKVTMFLVLSGFMINFLIRTRDNTPQRFFENRAARLYSVIVPALLLTAILDYVGFHLRPDLYLEWVGYHPENKIEQFLRAATFTNTTWSGVGGPGSNVSFWTLGLEGSYYVIFGLIAFAAPAWRILAVPIVLVLAEPVALMLLPVWLVGVVAYHLCTVVKPKLAVSLAYMVIPLLIWIGYEASVFGQPHEARLQPHHNLPWAHVVALMFGMHIVGAHGVMPRLGRVLLPLATPIRWLAGASFSLYLFHLPIIQFLTTVTPWQPDAWQNRVLMIIGSLLLVLALAEITERRKEPWRRLFAWIARLPQSYRQQPTRAISIAAQSGS